MGELSQSVDEMSNTYATISSIPEKLSHEVNDMQRVRNNIHKARKHMQKSRRDIRKLGGPEKARLLREIELYDDYGNRVTNLATLRAIAESDRIVAEWKRIYAG